MTFTTANPATLFGAATASTLPRAVRNAGDDGDGQLR
jgi:hypothetical protein